MLNFWTDFGKLFGSFPFTFGVFWDQNVVKMTSKLDAKIGLGKSGSPEGTSPNDSDESGGQEEGEGGGQPPPGGRRFGRKEEKRRKVNKLGGKGVGRNTGRFYTLVPVGRRIY